MKHYFFIASFFINIVKKYGSKANSKKVHKYLQEKNKSENPKAYIIDKTLKDLINKNYLYKNLLIALKPKGYINVK